MPYTDAGSQTEWAGLTRGHVVSPEFLLTAPDTTTPPDEMLTQKLQTAAMLNALPSVLPQRTPAPPRQGLSLLERRGNNPQLASGISLPSSSPPLDEEIIVSPPPTHAAISPLPAANKLYAGHTPLMPGSLSPVQSERDPAIENVPDLDDGSTTPEHDVALKGALSLPTLPTNPLDGASESISLFELDNVLEQIAQERDQSTVLQDQPKAGLKRSKASASASSSRDAAEDGLPLSRKGSADSRSSHVEYINGVPLKSPPLNFGAPLGQLNKN